MNDLDNKSLMDINDLIRGLKYNIEKYEELLEKTKLSVLLKSSSPKPIVVQESGFSGCKMLDCSITEESIENKLLDLNKQLKELESARDSMRRLIKQENAMIDRIIIMKEKGSTLAEISEGTGYSVSTIRRLLKEYYENSHKF